MPQRFHEILALQSVSLELDLHFRWNLTRVLLRIDFIAKRTICS